MRLESRHIEQTRAEFDHYKHMMDKVLGRDEEFRAQGKHKGGELVQLDGNSNHGSSSGTTTAEAAKNIVQSVADEGNSDDAPYEDEYEYDYEDDE